MNDIQPLINGRAYDWSQVEIKMANATIPFFAIDGLDYSENTEIEDNYGAGRYPVSRSYGNIEATATIRLHMDEIVRLQDSIETARLIDIPEFDLVVTYLHPDSKKKTKDVLKNVKFTANTRNLTQNDKKFVVEIALKLSHIEWGGTRFKPLFD